MTDNEFMELWNSESCVGEVSSKAGTTADLAKARAHRCRKLGLNLKKFPNNTKHPDKYLFAIFLTCKKTFRTFVSEIRHGRKHCSKLCRGSAISRRNDIRNRLRMIWRGVKHRCLEVGSKMFQYYGGRGINICQEWIDSFESFMEWSLANGYANNLEIDRINSDGNYEPTNCRWATRTQQMRNTRKRKDAKTSKYKGVSWHAKTFKWRAQITCPGRNPHIGMFSTEEEAARAYDSKAKEFFGEFAHINFKEGCASS